MGFSKAGVAVGLMLMVAVVEGAVCSQPSQVQNLLRPCVEYVKHGKTPVSTACCNGVKRLNNMAKTPAARRQACACILRAARLVNNINYSYVNSLPRNCGLRIPYTIDHSLGLL